MIEVYGADIEVDVCLKTPFGNLVSFWTKVEVTAKKERYSPNDNWCHESVESVVLKDKLLLTNESENNRVSLSLPPGVDIMDCVDIDAVVSSIEKNLNP